MRVLVLSDGEADLATQVAGGWAEQAPHDDVVPLPMSDGSTGFVEAVAAALGGQRVPTVVAGPDGVGVPAELLLAGETAYVEAGLTVRQGGPLPGTAPDATTSAGVGELLQAARAAGARRIVVGVGDRVLGSHDAGRGLLEALGAGSDLSGLAQVRDGWRSVELVLAAATGLPLLGFHGASAALGTEHGVSPQETQRLERELGAFVEQVTRALPPGLDLLTGRPRRPEREPSAGVGGGLGFALQLIGARTVAGADLLLDELGVREQLPGALAVLVTRAHDSRTVHDGVVAEAARAALAVASPSVVLAERVEVGRREGMALGIAGMYAARPAEGFAALGARVARTWSPSRPPG